MSNTPDITLHLIDRGQRTVGGAPIWRGYDTRGKAMAEALVARANNRPVLECGVLELYWPGEGVGIPCLLMPLPPALPEKAGAAA